jgi:hypothetical protein
MIDKSRTVIDSAELRRQLIATHALVPGDDASADQVPAGPHPGPCLRLDAEGRAAATRHIRQGRVWQRTDGRS